MNKGTPATRLATVPRNRSALSPFCAVGAAIGIPLAYATKTPIVQSPTAVDTTLLTCNLGRVYVAAVLNTKG